MSAAKACLFCKIIAKEIPSKAEYEDDEIYAFADVNPQAPAHILIVPKKHFSQVADISESDAELMGKLILIGRKLAAKKKLEKGYRIVINNGPQAGQTVFHLHFHLLGGRRFTWPPG